MAVRVRVDDGDRTSGPDHDAFALSVGLDGRVDMLQLYGAVSGGGVTEVSPGLCDAT